MMVRISMLAAALAALASGPAPAQHSTYAGENRQIKALSDDQVDQYRSGAGMGYALPAELNAFPGPLHVLQLADQLALSPEQRAATKQLMDAHKAEASAIGAKLVEAERSLDRLFASGKLDRSALAGQVRAVAALYGEYRLSHLETHRLMRGILSSEQVSRYDELRGYAGAQQHGKQPH